MDAPSVTALVAGTLAKVLVAPAYHSTDMEVHRNWLAVTYALPLRAWYTDTTSPWTLDYPPFFAYLSWLLAQPAAWVDGKMLDVAALGYASAACKAYMRATVLATELVLAAALYAHYTLAPSDANRCLLVGALLHPGLFIVDHVHFQYNGLLFGVLLWSLWAARVHRPLLSAMLFASLLNLKHIYLYVAPAWIAYLARVYLLPTCPRSLKAWWALGARIVALGVATVAPFAASILPFVHYTDDAPALLQSMYARLFPFHRGLIHAYWAPNVWALYTAADRVLVHLRGHATASASRGKVEDVVFGVLPSVRPPVCFALACACMGVYAWRLALRPTYRAFVVCVSLCALTSFAVGWHVHEKAILVALMPLTLVAADAYVYLRLWEILSAVTITSLFPLLYTPNETPAKLLYSAVWFFLVRHTLARLVLRPMPTNLGAIVHFGETQYMRGLAWLAFATNVAWPLATAVRPHWASPQRAFVPLMLTSVYCAVGVVWVWLRLSVCYWQEPPEHDKVA